MGKMRIEDIKIKEGRRQVKLTDEEYNDLSMTMNELNELEYFKKPMVDYYHDPIE